MIIRRRVIVIVALAIMIFTSTSSILSELRSAPAAFAGSGDYVVHSADAPTIFSSRVDVGIVPLLLNQQNITNAWAEIVTFSAWGDESFVIRGMDIDSALSDGRIPAEKAFLSGAQPDRISALTGSRLMDRLDLEPPCIIPLSGSYATGVEFVHVAGWFDVGSYLDDELIVSEDVARYLCNMPSDTASQIALTTDDPAWLEEVLSPDSARFAVFDVRKSKTAVVPGEEVIVEMEVRNWGSVAGDAHLTIADDGVLLDEFSLSLDASTTATVESRLSFDTEGTHQLEIQIPGGILTSSYLNISVVNPFLVIVASPRVPSGSPFNVTIVDNFGAPISGAEVEFTMGDDQSVVVTDYSGKAEIMISDAGICSLTASHIDYDGASSTVELIDPATISDEFIPAVMAFTLSQDVIGESGQLQGVIVVENAGLAVGAIDLPVFVDSSPWTVLSVTLGPIERKSVSFSIGDIAVGTHSIQAGTFSHDFIVEPWFADEQDLVQLALRYGGTGVLSSSTMIPIYQAAKISEGNVAVALFSMGAISALLASLAISAVFAKEIRLARRMLGILRSIGASRPRIRVIVLFQAFLNGLIGSAVGVVAGIAVAVWLASAGMFTAFGHTLTFEPDTSLLLLIVVGAVAISAGSSLVSAEIAARESPISSIRDLEKSVTVGVEFGMEEFSSEE
ncbi:MAG: FtsX-like permease family protein [Methanobacteriota archaeon]|nr:MAG: FtsX-like permease family protein [Euryarchaeota archaeon]